MCQHRPFAHIEAANFRTVISRPKIIKRIMTMIKDQESEVRQAAVDAIVAFAQYGECPHLPAELGAYGCN
jgi:hypothetical protein